jgi:hypothetical protein
MEGLEIILLISLLLIFAIVLLSIPLFIKSTHNKNLNRYFRVFSLLFIINAFCSLFNDKIGWNFFFILLESIVISTIVLSLSYIKSTKKLNCIYIVLFFIIGLLYVYNFIIENDKLSIFLFISFFFSFFISLFTYSILKKRGYEISIWGLAFNIEILITMSYIWFYFENINQNVWYYSSFIPILISVFILYMWLIWKKKKIKKLRRKKEDPSRFIPKE